MTDTERLVKLAALIVTYFAYEDERFEMVRNSIGEQTPDSFDRWLQMNKITENQRKEIETFLKTEF